MDDLLNQVMEEVELDAKTEQEFIAIEEEVRAMDAVNKKKAAHLAEEVAQSKLEQKKKQDSFLLNIFGGVLKNGCESNFDCKRPQVSDIQLRVGDEDPNIDSIVDYSKLLSPSNKDREK